jgi:hypothetical protein
MTTSQTGVLPSGTDTSCTARHGNGQGNPTMASAPRPPRPSDRPSGSWPRSWAKPAVGDRHTGPRRQGLAEARVAAAVAHRARPARPGALDDARDRRPGSSTGEAAAVREKRVTTPEGRDWHHQGVGRALPGRQSRLDQRRPRHDRNPGAPRPTDAPVAHRGRIRTPLPRPTSHLAYARVVAQPTRLSSSRRRHRRGTHR